MDDLKPIVYIIFAAIYFLSRVMKNKNKLKQQTQEKPVEQPQPLITPHKPVLTEVKEPRAKLEIKQKVFVPEKKVKKAKLAKRELMPGSIETTEVLIKPAELIEKETGFSSLKDKMQEMFSEQKKEELPSLEFDPRQAFMMKTLLERKFEV